MQVTIFYSSENRNQSLANPVINGKSNISTQIAIFLVLQYLSCRAESIIQGLFQKLKKRI